MIPRIFSIGRIFLFIFATLNLPVSLFAIGHNIKFENTSIGQGLSQSTVNCVLQDSRGFMWFGTEDGLNKYDGYGFTIYKSDPLDPNSLSDSYILAIYEDKSGVLWIGTQNGGLSKFDREKERFTNHRHNPSDPDSLSSNFVNSIYEDRAGVLWIGTYGEGLDRFDRERGKFSHYRHNPDIPDSLSSNFVNSIYEDRAGVLWIGTDDGLNRLLRNEKAESRLNFIRYTRNPDDPKSLSNNVVRAIHEDRDGVLWIGTDDGLNELVPGQKEEFPPIFIHFRQISDEPFSLSSNNVRSIYEDRAGMLWIGTYGGGLNLFDRDKGRFEHFVNEPGNPRSLSNNFVTTIYEDRAGVLWVGTFGGGVDRFDREKVKFMHYRNEPQNPDSLSNNTVFSIYEDRTGMLWVGTYGGGLTRFDRKKGKFTQYLHNPYNSNSLSNNNVRSICEDRYGNLWIGTYDGLNRFDPKKEKFVHYSHDPKDSESLSENYIRSVCMDKTGALWIGTIGGGLNRLVRNESKGSSVGFVHYTYDPDNPSSLSSNRVYSIYEDRARVLWVGTGSGLDKLVSGAEEESPPVFIHYRHDPDDPNSLSNNRVFSIYEDKSGVFWIGTYGGGLNKLVSGAEEGSPPVFVHYTEKNGLPNDVIYGILEDDNGNLWISTNNGLSRFDPQTETFRSYDINDGLQSNEFNSGAYYRSQSGEMFFGGINGFNAFYPDSIRDNPYVPPVVITNFQVFNKSVPIGMGTDGRSILEKSITEAEAVELSYRDRVFSFEFAALNFTSPEKSQYAYKMEGFEKDWNYVGNRRFVTYTNLHPGNYVFKVKGSNNDGVWNEEGVSLKIRVTPPFWDTWWFVTLSIIVGMAFVYGLHRYRIRLLRHRTKTLEKKVRERTSDLTSMNKRLKQEIVERMEAEKALRESEEKFRSLAEQSPNMVFINRKGRIVYANQKCEEIMGYKKDEFLSPEFDFLCLIAPESVERIKSNFRKHSKAKEVKPIEYTLVTKNRKRMEAILATKLVDYEGDKAILGVITDISEWKRTERKIKDSLKEKEVMLQEIHHRVKNNLQIISSLLNLQSRYIKDKNVLEIFKESQTRIKSMALIHNKLYQSKDMAKVDFADYIHSLSTDLFHSYRVNSSLVRLKINTEDVYLDINSAIPCGLIISELISNALKHAFPDGRRGEIVIDFHPEKDNRFTLTVADDGVGFPEGLDFRKTESLGMRLVCILTEQLQGTVKLNKKAGTKFEIRF